MKQDSKDSSILITGLFKSAAYKYRPPYWDTETDEERESPKKQTEGEKEKTHFAIKITNDEVFLLVEVNGNGVSVNNIISYLNQFTREYLKKKKKTKNFTVEYKKIARDNFISELESLKLCGLSIGDIVYDDKNEKEVFNLMEKCILNKE